MSKPVKGEHVAALMDQVDANFAAMPKAAPSRIVAARVLLTFRSASGYIGHHVFEDRGNSETLVEAMKECVRLLLIEGKLDTVADALNQSFRLSDEASQEVLHVEKRFRIKD